MSMVIVGFTGVTGADGTAVITGNGSSALTTHPTPAYGSNTAATNEYRPVGRRWPRVRRADQLHPAGRRHDVLPVEIEPGVGEQRRGHRLVDAAGRVGAPAHLSATSGAGAFSVGSTAALAHA
jgi:hypothetical protein